MGEKYKAEFERNPHAAYETAKIQQRRDEKRTQLCRKATNAEMAAAAVRTKTCCSAATGEMQVRKPRGERERQLENGGGRTR